LSNCSIDMLRDNLVLRGTSACSSIHMRCGNDTKIGIDHHW